MKNIFLIIFSTILLISCKEEKEISSINPVNWEKRISKITDENFISGATHLSVYSQVYSYTEHKKHSLTVTVSMRNTDRQDTIYIKKADYYDTHGKLIRSYFNHPIYLAPMETVEIVIDETDKEGGTGGNFMFDWIIKQESNQPLFEAVMISTSGQQGLSFTTTGVKVH
ncbi:DUF3124 domain-containing protein [Wenyingzhuangia marina]|uniref:DUF3124 domain-containing protein n=1 Tax=Wenyingzhuangia marina TaxID=1195760 RepID=A0A1M5TC82_9FLAO|nr:DUF3124 domain-containing protein [Wenyingzhuangia marina]GGF66261.1 hypothetical protein GCM10011397_06650 [Wenyingzhuangia marina]SHH48328.1 Protein of unknown function [Wenyingzhuangia marina]